MPETWQDAAWIFLTTCIALSVCGIIPWLVNKGFNAMTAKMTSMESGLTALRVDIQKERENRLVHYGLLEGKLAAQQAVCDERHAERKRRSTDEWAQS